MSQYPGPGFVPASSSNEPYGYLQEPPPGEAYGVPTHPWAHQYGSPAEQPAPPSSGYGAAPSQQYGQFAPGYPSAPVTVGYGFGPLPVAKKQPTLGIVSLVLVVLGTALLSAFMFTMGAMTGQMTPGGEDLTDAQTGVILGRTGLGVLFGSLATFAGWVVGIVATAINRGRGYGIASIVLGVLAPIIAFVVMVIGIMPYS